MKTLYAIGCACLLGAASRAAAPSADGAASGTAIDQATLARWSAPYRGWHYHPDHVVPANPVIGDITDLQGTDVPTAVPGTGGTTGGRGIGLITSKPLR